MSAPSTDLPPQPIGTIVTRVDSDRTDESPFGSKLTTPIDEDVQLFSGVNQRILESKHVEVHADSPVEHFGHQGERKFLEVFGDDDKTSKSGDYPPAPTPSPSLDSTEFFTPPGHQLGDMRSSRSRSASIYSQPNVPLPIPGETPGILSEDEQYPFINPDVSCENGAVNSSCDLSPHCPAEKPLSEDPAQTATDILALLPFASALLDDTATSLLTHDPSDDSLFPQLSLDNTLPILLRILVFPIWCAIAGAAILTFPRSLDFLLFRCGFAIPPPTPIRRFALFSDIAPQLVKIFLAALVALWCTYPTLSLVVGGGVATLTTISWLPFKVNKRIPLGEDDQQALYLVWEGYKHGGDCLRLKGSETTFLATDSDDDVKSSDEDF